MKTFILFWNPAISSYKLESFREFIKDQPFEYEFNWSIWDHQLAHEGDRFFMIRCKNKPVPGKLNKWGKQEWEPAIDDTTGICMAGHFSSDPYRGEDWSGKGRETYYMDMELTEAADPDKNIIVKTADLMAAIPDFDWKGGHSGRLLDEAVAEKLEALYKKALDANTGDIWPPATDVFID